MELCEFQKIDPSNRLCFPWLTHPALEVISKWNLDGLSVLEYGAGLSTLWWADKCSDVTSIEANYEWALKVYHNALSNGYKGIGEIKHESTYFPLKNGGKRIHLVYRQCNEGDQSKIEYYCGLPVGFSPDIVVVDGILRYECILKALTLPRPLTLIIDNWQQDYVFICPAAEEALKNYEGQFYVQPDHQDHSGRPWQTAIWHLK